MNDTRKRSAAAPAATTGGQAEPQEEERTELSPEDLEKVSGGVRRVVKVVNGKKY